jgi:hypothetical protein
MQNCIILKPLPDSPTNLGKNAITSIISKLGQFSYKFDNLHYIYNTWTLKIFTNKFGLIWHNRMTFDTVAQIIRSLLCQNVTNSIIIKTFHNSPTNLGSWDWFHNIWRLREKDQTNKELALKMGQSICTENGDVFFFGLFRLPFFL